jgi:hypothetical protein
MALIAFTLTPLPSRAEDPPLPPVQTVLARVRESSRRELQNDRLFQARYAFLRTKTTRELDSDGKVKKESTRRSRNRPGIVAARYVPPGQSPATTPRSQPAQKSPNTQNDAFDKNEFALNDDLLNRFDFTIAGREQLHGRSSLQIQFKPANKKLPSRELKDRFINKAAGAVWVDEGDWTITKANVHLTETVNVGGGLVGAVKKFNYAFDRERTNEGLWYTRDMNWRLEGRELFSRKILEYQEKRSEVKKIR